MRDNLESTQNELADANTTIESVESDLAIEKEKNAYLLATRRTLSPDAEGLIHTIKINSVEIRDGIDNLIDDLNDEIFDLEDFKLRLGNIRVNAVRNLKLTEIATRSDFNEDIEQRSVDIVQFLVEYLKIYGSTYTNEDEVKFEVISNNISLPKSISVLNISIILDNLISNSIKWNASKIQFLFQKEQGNKTGLIISDDGLGISPKFISKPNRIFELGVRDKAPKGYGGSGIGLFYAKKLLKDMDAGIEFLGNGIYLKGASFKITF